MWWVKTGFQLAEKSSRHQSLLNINLVALSTHTVMSGTKNIVFGWSRKISRYLYGSTS